MEAELVDRGDRHPLVSLLSACFWVIRTSLFLVVGVVSDWIRFSVWLLSWTKALVAFATITIPRYIYAVLSYSMTLTVLPLMRHSELYWLFLSWIFGISQFYSCFLSSLSTTGYVLDISTTTLNLRNHHSSSLMSTSFTLMSIRVNSASVLLFAFNSFF